MCSAELSTSPHLAPYNEWKTAVKRRKKKKTKPKTPVYEVNFNYRNSNNTKKED